MAYSVDLQVRGNLLGVARIFRLLRRHAVHGADVALERRIDGEVARVYGTLSHRRDARALAAALSRTPAVVQAVILDETRVLAEISR